MRRTGGTWETCQGQKIWQMKSPNLMLCRIMFPKFFCRLERAAVCRLERAAAFGFALQFGVQVFALQGFGALAPTHADECRDAQLLEALSGARTSGAHSAQCPN